MVKHKLAYLIVLQHQGAMGTSGVEIIALENRSECDLYATDATIHAEAGELAASAIESSYDFSDYSTESILECAEVKASCPPAITRTVGLPNVFSPFSSGT